MKITVWESNSHLDCAKLQQLGLVAVGNVGDLIFERILLTLPLIRGLMGTRKDERFLAEVIPGRDETSTPSFILFVE